MKKLIFVCFLLLNAVSGLLAQVVPFTEDPSALLKQLEETLNATGRKDMKDAFEVFEKSQKAGLFTATDITLIVGVLNKMQKEKLPTNPFYGLYIESAVSANKYKGSTLNTFTSWHALLEQMFILKAESRSNEKLKQFLEFSGPFLRQRTLRESEGGLEWTATSDRFSMRMEDKSPIIEWDLTDLKLLRKTDSILLYGTSGKYYPLDLKWVGYNGEVRWGDRIQEMKDVKASLSAYEIDLRRGLYKVDSVLMTYPTLLGATKVLGSLEDKLVFGNERSEGSYPRFESYARGLNLQNLGRGIECVGGVKINGFTIYAVGEPGNPAIVKVKDGPLRKFDAKAQQFSIKREELVIGERVNIAMYFGEDSIWHPASNMRFNIKTHELELKRGDRGSERNPFFDTYHQFSIVADKINWSLDKDSLYIGKRTPGMVDLVHTATFESSLYFEQMDYLKVQNIADYNPIAVLKLYAEKNDTRNIQAGELAKLLDPNLDAGMVQPLLFDLSSRGFVRYTPETQLVEILDKVVHYANSSIGKTDYDVIRIYSDSETFDNAVFSMRDTGMVINAVKRFELSQKQQVALLPDAQFVTVKKNRDIDFDGRLFAGYSTYMGKGFHFEYDKFMIEMDSIRYMDLYIPNGKMTKKNTQEFTSIKSRIEFVTGILQIDAPNNKSGREELPFFPSIQSKDFSYVFYQDKATRNAVYKRDSFYFKLDKFFLNSLDSLKEEDIRFKGNIYSAEIFPVFKEELEIMPDTSLGFVYQTPEAGLGTYRKIGNYKGGLNLSNLGLLGDGTLTYLGSTCVSDSFVYMPKQMLAAAKRWDNKEERASATKFPQAIGVGVDVDWVPYNDSMYVYSKAKPFDMFKANDHKLNGSLILTPKSLNGRGKLDWSKAVMTSPQFSFGAFEVSADTTNLGIKTKGDQIAVQMDNIDGEADFDTQKGHFRANDLFGTAQLPSIQYVTSMNEFDWDIKTDKINFLSDPNKMAGFTSLHPDQDSLFFQGKTALYDINANQLNVGGVPLVQTCDAYIYPVDGEVIISEGAVMGTLKDATIVCDTINKNHVIKRVTANITGKKSYTANGFYSYDIGPLLQEIKFDNIIGTRVLKGSQATKPTETRATGAVSDSTIFYMDVKTLFRGKIALNASDVNLDFDGFAQFDVATLPAKQWFSIQSKGDKKNLNIAYTQPRNPQGDPLHTGFFVSAESSVLYPRTMQALYFTKDRPILPARGVFRYDQKTDEFVFGDSTKVLLGGKKGTRVSFQVKMGKLTGEGPLQLGTGLKNCKMTASGRISADYLPEDIYFTARDTVSGALNLPVHPHTVTCMAGFSFDMLPENLMRIMAADIQTQTFDAPDIPYAGDMPLYERALADLFPDGQVYLNIMNEFNRSTLRVPEKSNPFQILVSALKLRWDQENQSFVSDGSRLGINSIAGQVINKQVTGYFEVIMPKNEDDRVYIYLKNAAETFYFIGYNKNILSVTSNNEKFNAAFAAIKAKDRTKKLDNGETYEMQFVEPSSAAVFVSRVQAAQSRK